jgi:hypothetical protein
VWLVIPPEYWGTVAGAHHCYTGPGIGPASGIGSGIRVELLSPALLFDPDYAAMSELEDARTTAGLGSAKPMELLCVLGGARVSNQRQVQVI